MTITRMDWDRIEQRLLAVERRVGRGGLASLVGVLLLGLAALYVEPATTCINHGCWYQDMALDPLHAKPDNPLRLRLLTPYVAHALHLTGDAYLVFTMLLTAALIAACYLHARAVLGPATSLGVAAAIASSTCVLYSLHFEGYADPASYLLVLASLAVSRYPPVMGATFGIALVNHEGNAFVAPWLALAPWLSRMDEKKRRLLYVAAGVLCLALAGWAYLALRRHLLETQEGMVFKAVDYTSREKLSWNLGRVVKLLPLGAFMAFRLLWYVPLAATLSALRRRERMLAVVLALIVVCAASQLVLASDTSRFFGMAFPALLLGARHLSSVWGEDTFRRRLWILLGWNMLVPVYYIGQETLIPLMPLPVRWLVEHFLPEINVHKMWWGDCAFGC
jgi:hypothetical protein